MPIDLTLARVERDLAEGRPALARQRLQGLIGSHPTRLDLRQRLAAVYRAEGDLAQAGRWSFLVEVPDPIEMRAFERAYSSDPFRMMKALGWRGEESLAGTPPATARLRGLRERAEVEAGGPVAWANPRRPERAPSFRDRLGQVGCAFLALVMLVVLTAGFHTVITEGVDTIVGWLS